MAALTAEAEKWRRLAGTMGKAHGSLTSLELNAPAFFAGTDLASPAVLAPTYNDTREMVARYCQEAQTEFNELAGAMDRARGLYEQSDARAEKKNTIPIYGH
jgi:hypothetical protein